MTDDDRRFAALELEPHDAGAVLPLQVQAGSRRNAIRDIHAGRLRVSVTAAPEKGKANRAVIRLVCEALGLRRSSIELLSGTTSPQKRLLLRGISSKDARRRLAEACQ